MKVVDLLAKILVNEVKDNQSPLLYKLVKEALLYNNPNFEKNKILIIAFLEYIWTIGKWIYYDVLDILKGKSVGCVGSDPPSKIRLSKFLSPLEFLAIYYPKRNIRLMAYKLSKKLDINITQVCNYTCQYCYQRSRDGNWRVRLKELQNKELTLEDLKKILYNAKFLGVKRVKITGGEPLIKGDITLNALKLAYELGFEEVELVTNGYMLGKYVKDLHKFAGSGERFHLHTSIDAISYSKGLNKFSYFHFEKLRENLEMLRRMMPQSKISVNTMWTKFFIDNDDWKEMYDFFKRIKITHWTISFPYIVEEIVATLKEDVHFIPPYEVIVEKARQIYLYHISEGKPFMLSMPLIVKDELLFDFHIPKIEKDCHPCFPCHGSFFIIGPEGDTFDCLLTSYTKVNIKNFSTLLEAAIAGVEQNTFYQIKISDVNPQCKSCRYENICMGQCVNDRVNANGAFNSRDKTACSLLVLSEIKLWPYLDKQIQNKIKSLLNFSGFVPSVYFSLYDVVTKAPPITNDFYPSYRGIKSFLTKDELVVSPYMCKFKNLQWAYPPNSHFAT